MANAWARMSKLEAAMSAVDPTYPGLLEAFKKVRAPDTDEASAKTASQGQNSFLDRDRKMWRR